MIRILDKIKSYSLSSINMKFLKNLKMRSRCEINLFYKIFFFVSFLLFYSCEKGLDLSSQTSYSESTFFTTVDQFELFANQFYYYLPVVGRNNDRDIYSDIVAARTTNTISNGSYYATEESDTWDDAYTYIRNTTYLIQKGDEVNADLKEEAQIYIGEAKFFRAFSYFNLFRDFGGVPIIDKVLDLDDDELFGARNSREEVVNFILNDLEEAIDVLPVESAIAEGDKGRVSKGAALALKARISLFEGTWRKFRENDGYEELLDEAIDASNQIIESGEYELFDRRDVLGDESYKYFFILDKVQSNTAGLTKVDQSEYILRNRYDESIRKQSTVSTNSLPNPTKKFADMFLCTDGLPIDKSTLYQGKLTVTSEFENRDLRMENIFVKHGDQLWESQPAENCRDWTDPAIGGWTASLTFGTYTLSGYMENKFNPEILSPSMDYPVIRYAEVLLINAEALYERNGFITDAQLDLTINMLRERAGVANLSNNFASANNLDLQTEIRKERTIELFMEGQRYDDLRRWKTAEIEMPQSLLGVLWKGTQFETDPEWEDVFYSLDNDGYIIIEDASERTFEEKHYLMPLPTRQILLNSQLEQNAGWE
ncbi:RagB/SusD family nutrient uptake outer membrane protein [Maribellus comscasis]|uniref:RagB/SusD family nutrient uptake outer membrane protein n=1 Tax=Maribellus comscasis TaxID=2681766 RepID=A0A6I6K3J3_9BACT|nr:RagB/SusD family nutrient uptake outer membrane protein [Maribellus comscasis]QGY46163.1 RagB/SusD family nutrient uptake outer membrane protein [Maribellus comscasis]